MSAQSADARFTRPLREFVRSEAASGTLLLACACVALAVANSPWADGYHHVLATTLSIAGPGQALSLTVHEWINDALMGVFFLLVGLEIKREALVGELASPRQAALPIVAAVGGMLVPALVYLVVNGGGVEARGWAIPMATDIAFALAALSLLARRAPGGLRAFLAALAIVDDMGALLVIALFYATAIAWAALAKAAVCVIALAALNMTGVRRLTPYLVVGVVLWYFVHQSGVHATIAGVILAFSIPATRQQEAAVDFDPASEEFMSPLVRLEHALQGFSAFVVMPLFALSNAGVSLGSLSGGSVTLAVVLGLTIGKPLGITAAAMAAVRLRLAALPDGVTWTALHGCAWLGGIGFTMSLFIATLAFEGTTFLDAAKVGILSGSLLSGAIGAIVLRLGTRGVSTDDTRLRT